MVDEILSGLITLVFVLARTYPFEFYRRQKVYNMWWMAIYAAALFFVLTPGVVLSLPPGGSRTTVALTHAGVFGLAWALTHKMVWKALH